MKKDPNFITNLTTPEALEYWVRLMIESYFSLYDNARFTESTKVTEYNHAYHEENNGCLTFIRDHDATDFEGLRPPEVYDMYEQWATDNGVTVQSKKILRESLDVEMGLVVKDKKVNGKTQKVYVQK
jgi:putative DNA primase/helicase